MEAKDKSAASDSIMDPKILFSTVARLSRRPWILQWLVILLFGLLIFLVQWSSEASPDCQITNAKISTSADHSTFVINDFKQTYYVGDTLHVTIIAKDSTGVPKRYGGDLFGARVFSKELKARVYGEVLDHQNGTYSARFMLPWAGRASVAVNLIHSNKTIQVCKQRQDRTSDHICFHGYFLGRNPEGARVEERVECQIKWDGVVMSSQRDCCCEYQDAHLELAWQCHRPSTLPCDALVEYYIGGQRHRLAAIEKIFLKSEHVNQWLKGDKRQIRVTASKVNHGARESWKPGLSASTPAGFYMNMAWTWLVCAARPFTVTGKGQCLKDKHIYFMGDATSKQWFDLLIQAVPTLKRTFLHSLFKVGPMMAVDVDNNINMSYSTHGLPLPCLQTPMSSVHHIRNETDKVVGGPQTIIVYTLNFNDYPLPYFALHVSLVHCSVVELLKHEPETKIIITTGPKDIFVNDGSSKQRNEILREAFRDVGVYILDVGQITNTDIHPVPVIIRNEIDILLSFISFK